MDVKKTSRYTHTQMQMLSSTSKDNFLERYTRDMDVAAGPAWKAERTRPLGCLVFCACMCPGDFTSRTEDK